MATNKFGATCATCTTYVKAGDGLLVRRDGKWVTYCADCGEPKPAAPPRGNHDGWHRGPMAAFDVETSGVDPLTDFIVTAALVDSTGTRRSWLIDPGEREIPAEATAIHGIDTARARAEGRQPALCLAEIGEAMAEYLAADTPIAIYNAPFDLTILQAELHRHNLPQLPYTAPIIDPLVIDKQLDRYRKGKRTLAATSAFYEVVLTDAHTADGDALACLLLAQDLGARFPELAADSLRTLHEKQVQWYAEQAASLQSYFDRRNPDGGGAVVDPNWPVIPGGPDGPGSPSLPGTTGGSSAWRAADAEPDRSGSSAWRPDAGSGGSAPGSGSSAWRPEVGE
ncbi:DNA polymerase III subunit epsilon [Embleya scabrispora]|uniref:DNA polymerase III subunit epsilon n=1 Tax=Embleya scabrispora TaxID=159449 RepID=A0A1T3P3B4_9ACTN|nr:exonuclease domain-containing protein [Embleya scabrispora]OPC83445.1 DNA polymerase III subunit epsilon [Embleya scabrispora]